MLCGISLFKRITILWPHAWPILEDVPVYCWGCSGGDRYDSLVYSVAQSFLSSLAFCLVSLSIIESRAVDCNCWTLCFSVPFCQFLLNIFWGSVWCVWGSAYICIFLVHRPFYQYIMSLSTVIGFHFRSILSDISIVTPPVVTVWVEYLFLSITFSLFIFFFFKILFIYF